MPDIFYDKPCPSCAADGKDEPLAAGDWVGFVCGRGHVFATDPTPASESTTPAAEPATALATRAPDADAAPAPSGGDLQVCLTIPAEYIGALQTQAALEQKNVQDYLQQQFAHALESGWFV